MSLNGQRFAIKIATWVRPVFLIIGATESKSQVTVERGQIRVQLGYYKLSIPSETLESAERARWRWYRGLGIRTNGRDTVALVGALENVVLIRLSKPTRATVLRFPVQMTKLYLSVDDPERFMDAIQSISRRQH